MMAELNPSLLSAAFQTARRRMTQLLDFANAAAPAVRERPDLLPELADSVVVLAVARLDEFFRHLLSLGTRHRQAAVRKHFAKHGHQRARTCDLPTLVKLVRQRISFEDGGKRLDNLFRLIFECSAWPSDQVRDVVLDLVLLRHFIIHSSGQDWSQDDVSTAAYAAQFRRADVVSVRRYQDLAVYSVDHYKALVFLRDAVSAVVAQLQYLEERLAQQAEGTQLSEQS
jgi:hypothetical protein